MVATVGSIAVKFQADMSTLAATLNRGEKRVSDFANKSERHASRVNRALGGIRSGATSMVSSLSRTALGGAVGGLLSVTAAIAGAKSALSEFDKTAKAAKLSGLNSDLYQALVFGADLAGVSLEKTDAALQSFRRNTALAATQQGTLYTTLKKANPELLAQLKTLTTQEDRLRAVSDALKSAKTDTDRVAIATAAFGRNGQAMIPVLSDGAAGLDEMAQEASKLGIIIDRDLLARSEELTDELSIATRVMDVEFKSAMIELAPVLVKIARLAGSVASAIRSVSDAGSEMGQRSTSTLKRQLSDLNSFIDKRENNDALLQFDMPGAPSIEDQKAQRDELINELRRRALDSIKPQLAAQASDLVKPLEIDLSPTTGGQGSGRQSTRSSAQTRNASATAALREAEAVKTLVADLQHELALIGQTDTQRRISEELRRAGSLATNEQRQAISNLIVEIEREKAAHESAQQAIEARQAATDYLVDGSIDALSAIVSGAESAEDAVLRMAIAFAQAAAQGALLGEGPLAGLFPKGGGNGLLGGAIIPGILHTGGDVASSGGARIGHKEVLTLLENDETVFTRGQTAAIHDSLGSAAKGGGSPYINMSVHNTFDGEAIRTVIRDESGNLIAQNNAALQKQMPKMVHAAQKSNQLRGRR